MSNSGLLRSRRRLLRLHDGARSLVSALCLLIAPAVLALPGPAATELAKHYGQLPLGFEANHGQFDAPVHYLAQGQGYTLFLTPDETVLSLQKQGGGADISSSVVRAHLLGASASPVMQPEDLQAGHSHYLHGNNPARWVRDVEHYSRVRYRDVYPGVDLVYYGNQGELEYDFVLAPYADPRSIRMHYAGIDKAALSSGGALKLQTRGGDLQLKKPEVYQDINGRRVPVSGQYIFQRSGKGVEVAFRLGHYDRRHALVIDPVLVYSTYLGGSGNEFSGGASVGIAVDSSGQAYVTGTTLSTNFPLAATRSPDQGSEAFVTKFSADGQTLLYSTYLGGGGADQGFAIAVNAAGEAFVTGSTTSVDFPVQSALFPARSGDPDPSVGGRDAFVTRLSTDGRTPLYSTYLGGSDDDDPTNFGGETGYAIAVDALGQIYVAGRTTSVRPPSSDEDNPRDSILFPTVSAVQPNPGSSQMGDGFITKFAADGQSLIYSTYLGGAGNETAFAIAVDAAQQASVAGSTTSIDFPLSSAIQLANGGGTDAFVTGLSADGRSYRFSTYLGGTGVDTAFSVAIGSGGQTYVTGNTASANFPVRSALDSTLGGTSDAFVTIFAPDGRSLQYSSFLGGTAADFGRGIALDRDGHIYLTGYTSSTNFPVAGAFQPALAGGSDAYITELAADGSSVIFSSYLGGTSTEQSYAIAVDANAQIYIAGITQSTNFRTQSPFQTANGGGIDAFVAHVGAAVVAVPGQLSLAAGSYSVAENGGTLSIPVSRTGGGNGAVSVSFSTADGTATAGSDYVAQTGTLNWADGDVTDKIITLQIIDDSRFEPNEDFSLALRAPTGGATLGTPPSATITVVDNDIAQPGILQFGNATYSVNENRGSVTVNVARTSGSDGAVSVSFSTANGTATAGSDYTAQSGTLNWADGDAADKIITLQIINDDQLEPSETFNVTLSAPAGSATLGSPTSATVTIVDDEIAQPGVLQFSAPTYTVDEGGGSLVVSVTRTLGSDGPVSVDYATGGGTASAVADYLPANGTLNWATGDVSPKTISILITDDSIIEANETFNIVLSNVAGGAALGAPSTARATIVDNETPQPGALQFSQATYSVGESDGALTVSVDRAVGSNGAVSVHYASSNGTATAGADYVANSGTLNWADGDQAPKTFTININNDALAEGDETINLTLSAPAGGAVLGSPATAIGTIVDDEVLQPGTLQFGAAAVSAGESSGSVTISVTRVGGGDGAVSVRYFSSGGSATVGVDYDAVNGTLNWANGDTAPKTFRVLIDDDTVLEGDETFGLSLAEVSGGATIGTPDSETVTIIDNEVARNGTIQLSAPTYGVGEGEGSVRITATRVGGSDGAVSVNYATRNGTAVAGSDYTTQAGALTWASGDSEPKSFSVPILQDSIVDPGESFTVSLSGPSGNATLGTPASATVTIVDDEVAPRNGSIQLSTSTYESSESSGSVTITATRTDGSDGAVSVSYATRNATAIAGSDYTAQSGTLNWAAGDTEPKTFAVPILPDNIDEPSETFGVSLSNPTGGAALGTPASATVTIDDSISRGDLSLSAAAYSVGEGDGSLTVTVLRQNGSDGAVSINYTTLDGTAGSPADYNARSGTLNWADGDAAPKSFTIPIIDDSDFEGPETFSVQLSAPTGGASQATPGTAVVTIQDNEVRPGSLQFEAPTYRVVENTGVARINVTRTGGTQGAVSVHYATHQGTATPGSDYNATSGDFSWADGDATPRTLVVQIIDDGSVEGDETFSVDLGNPTGGATLGGPPSTTITIADDEVNFSGDIRLGASAYGVSEASGTIALTVLRGGSSDGAVSVAYSTVNGQAVSGSDYVAASGRLNWAAGDLEPKTIQIQILSDANIEPDENFSVVLSSPTGGVVLESPSSANVVITDSSTAGGGGSSGGGGGAVDPYVLALLLAGVLARSRTARAGVRRLMTGA